MKKLSAVAIRSSYLIYTRKNKEWGNPESLFIDKSWHFLRMVGHSFTTVERYIPTLPCNVLWKCYFICQEKLYEVFSSFLKKLLVLSLSLLPF